MNNFILVHSGNRDFYQVALALHEHGYLKYLVTDDFKFRKDAPGQLAPYVKTSGMALLITFLIRFLRKGSLNSIKDNYLSKYAYQLAKKNSGNNVLAYSYYSNYVFAHLKGKKILFQLHPHPVSVRNIFLEEISIHPESRVSLSQEHELQLSDNEFKQMAGESLHADHIIVASGFTKRTLIENGIWAEKIKIVPYGVNHKVFVERKECKRNKDTLKVLFVGSLNQRKGLSYLASAIKQLQNNSCNIEFIVTGRGIIDKELVLKYGLKNVVIKLNVAREELVSIYQDADVFVFPSLCEGFGHVILEAMATGLPVIATENTAGPDIITDGYDGFIVPVRQVDALVEKLDHLYHNPDVNCTMGKRAAETARKYTWENFRKGIITVIDEFSS